MATLQTPSVMSEETRADLVTKLRSVRDVIPLDAFREIHHTLAEIRAAERKIDNNKLPAGKRDQARVIVSKGGLYLESVSRQYGIDLAGIKALERTYTEIGRIAETFDLSNDDLTALL